MRDSSVSKCLAATRPEGSRENWWMMRGIWPRPFDKPMLISPSAVIPRAIMRARDRRASRSRGFHLFTITVMALSQGPLRFFRPMSLTRPVTNLLTAGASRPVLYARRSLAHWGLTCSRESTRHLRHALMPGQCLAASRVHAPPGAVRLLLFLISVMLGNDELLGRMRSARGGSGPPFAIHVAAGSSFAGRPNFAIMAVWGASTLGGRTLGLIHFGARAAFALAAAGGSFTACANRDRYTNAAAAAAMQMLTRTGAVRFRGCITVVACSASWGGLARLQIQDIRLRTRIMSVNCLTWCSSRTRLARIRGARVARTHAHFQLALTSGFRERTLSFKCCCSRGRLPIPAASSWRRSAAGLPRATSRCGDSNRCSAARLFREGSLGSLGTPRRAPG